jgi:hypothetical protein
LIPSERNWKLELLRRNKPRWKPEDIPLELLEYIGLDDGRGNNHSSSLRLAGWTVDEVRERIHWLRFLKRGNIAMEGLAKWVRTAGRFAPFPCAALTVALGWFADSGRLKGAWLLGAVMVITLVMTVVACHDLPTAEGGDGGDVED